MPDPDRAQELAALYQSWEPEELMQAAGAEASTYSPEALALIRQELDRRGLAPGPPETPAPATRRSLRGVKGFLLLLVLDITARSLWYLVNVYVLLTGRPTVSGGLVALLFAGISLLGLFIVLLLLRKDARAPAATAAWTVLVLLALAVLTRRLWGAVPTKLLVPAFYPVLWLPYLWRSRRVKATYGPAPAPLPDLAAFD